MLAQIQNLVGLVVGLAMIGFAVYVAIVMVVEYRKEAAMKSPPRTKWRIAIAAARDSETILVTRILAILAGGTSQLDSLADAANMPEAKTLINATIGDPKILAAIMFAIAFWVNRARSRTLPPAS